MRQSEPQFLNPGNLQGSATERGGPTWQATVSALPRLDTQQLECVLLANTG